MFFNFKVCLTTCFCRWIFREPKNCYRWFPMISGHGTKKIVIHGIWNPRACILYYTVNWLFPRTTLSTGQSRNCLCYDRTIVTLEKASVSNHKKVSFCLKSIWCWQNFHQDSTNSAPRDALLRSHVAVTNCFVCSKEFLWKSLLQQQFSVAVTEIFTQILQYTWSDLSQLVNRPVHKEWFVAVICCLVCPDHNVHQEPGRKWRPENLALLTFVSTLNYLKIKMKAQCLLSSFISTL